MKYFYLLPFLLLLISCNDDSPATDTPNSANAIYLNPDQCCSNIELIEEDTVLSDTAGHNVTLLAAVNTGDFDLALMDGDSLLIEYTLTDQQYACDFICNSHNGIPVKLISLKRI